MKPTGRLKPIYDYTDKVTEKIEDILLNHLENMVICLNQRDKEGFDESMEFTEFLLEEEKNMFDELIDFKVEIEKVLYQKVADVVLKSKSMANSIKKKRFKHRNTLILEWDFRKAYLKKLVKIYTKNQLLTHRIQTYAELIPIERENE